MVKKIIEANKDVRKMSLSDLLNGKNNLRNLEQECELFGNYTQDPVYITMYNKGEAELVYMSPKAYFEKCIEMQKYPKNFDNYMAESIVKSKANKYKNAMKKGEKFPIPTIDYAMDHQEGRHRAYAAQLLGCEKIPVIIVYGDNMFSQTIEDSKTNNTKKFKEEFENQNEILDKIFKKAKK